MVNLKVFISYAREDNGSVRELYEGLYEYSRSGFTWIDPSAEGANFLSENWHDDILSKIRGSDCFISVVSPDSANSPEIMAELTEAKRLGKPILFVIIQPANLPDNFRSDVDVLDIQDIEGIERALFTITSVEQVRDSTPELSDNVQVRPPSPQAPAAPAPVNQPAPAYRMMPSPAPAPEIAAPHFGSTPQPEDVFFTAYYPRDIQAERRYGLIVYAHLQSALAQIAKDVEKFKAELGDQIPAPKTAKKSANLKSGTPITITPECDENAIVFDPPSLTKKWEDDWKRFNFDFKPSANLSGETISGRIVISVYGTEQASINFAFEVVPTPKSDPAKKPPEGVLAAAKLAATPTTGLYQHIFISYSRKDRIVAEIYRKAQLARGDDVFMDTYSIRVGENWQAALAHAIDQADVFQLFWSKHSAESENVRHEWIHALNSRCSDSDCAAFIRPIFWVEPMPAPPPKELSERKINFRYVPLLTESGLFGWLKKLFGGT